MLYTVGQTGGHFGAGLGVIELTIALHYVFDTPDDRLLWDVGHQAYPHKILTGRRERMASLRQKDGIAAFPRRSESEYDTFGVGHSSTSISAALGMAIAARLQDSDRKAIAVIGDGALTAGMAFEALNHAPEVNANMLVILNDNDMSISRNVGGLSNYLAKILSSRTYASMREGSKKVLSRLPGAWEIARRTEEYAKGMLVPGTLFEELGWNYIGPIDGHDLPTLIATLRNMRDLKGPQFLHIVTKKGKGFAPAEVDPIGYHAITKLEPLDAPAAAPKAVSGPKYSAVFGEWLCDMAAADARLVGITPAMKEGSDLVAFSERFPSVISTWRLPSSTRSLSLPAWPAKARNRWWRSIRHSCNAVTTNWYTTSPCRTSTCCSPSTVPAWSAKTARPTLAATTCRTCAASRAWSS